MPIAHDYVENLAAIYRDILTAFAEFDTRRKFGYGLSYQSLYSALNGKYFSRLPLSFSISMRDAARTDDLTSLIRWFISRSACVVLRGTTRLRLRDTWTTLSTPERGPGPKIASTTLPKERGKRLRNSPRLRSRS